MRYKEAFKVSARQVGVIRCTYADLFGADGKKLFSLQSKNVRVTEGVDPLLEERTNYVTEDVNISYELPVVEVEEYSDKPLVPMRLTDTGAKVITYYLDHLRKVRKWTVTRVWNFGRKEVVKVCYKMSRSDEQSWKNADTAEYHHEITSEEAVAPQYARMAEAINNNETIYAKPAAFIWYPMDLDIVRESNEEVATLDAQIEEARQEMESAKALLAAVATTNIF